MTEVDDIIIPEVRKGLARVCVSFRQQPWCYPENTTRVVLFVPLVVTFYVGDIILNHDVNVVEIHENWYNSHPDEKFHF
jgi:hypothetical protein